MKNSNKTAMLFSYEWVPLLEAMRSETAVKIIFALITLDQTGEIPDLHWPLIPSMLKVSGGMWRA